VTYPGQGGQQPSPFNAPAGQATAPGVQAGVSGQIVRANKVVVSGAGEGVFSYSGAPAAGNLVATAGLAASGTDPYGNQTLGGTATYGSGFATAMISGALLFYLGSLSGGWTFAAQLTTDTSGDLFLETNGGILELSAAGNVSISGGLTVSGTFSASGNTGTSGLTNGTINGTSGAASAGTAHTHGAGSFAVNNGTHNHTL
jgi:hypothetical protein